MTSSYFFRASVSLAVGVLTAGGASAALPIQHWTRPDGAQVFFVESRAVPIVDAQVDFDAGSRREPTSQTGLASTMGAMLDKGITAHGSEAAMDENALNDAWADLGAQFGAGASNDRFTFSLRSLSDPALLTRAASLAAREIGEPSFPDAVWQVERQRIVAALREADTRPGTRAGKLYAQAVYGDHPYGRQTTETTLAMIDVTSMRAFHERLRSCGAKVSVVGALDRAQADRLAGQLLGRLRPGPCLPQPEVPDTRPLAAAQDIREPFKAAQAYIYIGQPGIGRADPDFFAFTLGNYLLGGGSFASRLTAEVREKRGLSYSISSGFEPYSSAGAFTIGLQTRPDQASQAVDVVRTVLTGFVSSGPTEREMQAAKDNLIGGFPLRLDSNAKLIGNVANIGWYGLPLNYLDTWTDRMRALTAEDVKKAFARVLHPDRMVTVVVGAAP